MAPSRHGMHLQPSLWRRPVWLGKKNAAPRARDSWPGGSITSLGLGLLHDEQVLWKATVIYDGMNSSKLRLAYRLWSSEKSEQHIIGLGPAGSSDILYPVIPYHGPWCPMELGPYLRWCWIVTGSKKLRQSSSACESKTCEPRLSKWNLPKHLGILIIATPMVGLA